MRLLLSGACAAAVLACAVPAQSQALKILPVAGVYGLTPSACFPGDGVVTAKVATEFCGQLGEDERLKLGRYFQAKVGSAFPGVIASLDGQIAPGETAEGRLSKTLVATLHVSRVDLWRVEKPAAYDVYVPLTVSLFLTNVLTGEVLFVENYSTVVQGTLGRDTYLQQARAQLSDHLTAAVDALVSNAAARFKPYPVTGKVVGRAGELFVFDVGRKGGIREGDAIGEDAEVVFSDANAAIIKPILGELAVGRTLSRQVAQPVEMLEKPSALVVVASAPEALSSGYVTAIFEEALGRDAGLAIAPVNPSFSAVRAFALGEAKLSSRLQASRALPDYFIRVSVAALEPLDVATNVEGVRRRVFDGRAFVEVIDHSGRVVFATRGSDRIVEEVAGGIAFSPEQRRDTVLKNALTRAAQQLGKEFRPAQMRLEAKAAGDEVEIADPGGALGLGATATVLRKTGMVVGGAPVWAPLGKVQVTSVQGATARAASMELEPLRVRSGDQIAFDSATGVTESRRRFSPCTGPDGRMSVSRRGAVEQPLYGQIALNSFAGQFKGPVYIPSFPGEVRPWLADFARTDRLAALNSQPADVCFEPVHQVDQSGQAAAGAFVTTKYSVALGYVLRRGEERLGGSGLQTTLTATGVPGEASEDLRLRSLQFDLADEAAKLTAIVAKALKPPQ